VQQRAYRSCDLKDLSLLLLATMFTRASRIVPLDSSGLPFAE
jgi:hypothetical protein